MGPFCVELMLVFFSRYSCFLPCPKAYMLLCLGILNTEATAEHVVEGGSTSTHLGLCRCVPFQSFQSCS